MWLPLGGLTERFCPLFPMRSLLPTYTIKASPSSVSLCPVMAAFLIVSASQESRGAWGARERSWERDLT